MPHRLKEDVGVQLDAKAAENFVPRKGRKKSLVDVCGKEGEGKVTQKERREHKINVKTMTDRSLLTLLEESYEPTTVSPSRRRIIHPKSIQDHIGPPFLIEISFPCCMDVVLIALCHSFTQ